MGAFKTEKPWVREDYPESMDRLASIILGFILGFGFLTTWHAIQQTNRMRKYNSYIVLVWLQIFTCITYTFLCYLYLIEVLPHSFAFYMGVVTTWGIQIQCLLQIIANRICILVFDRKKQMLIKGGAFGLMMIVIISVYVIWVPARLQINSTWMHINNVWDRVEKCVFLLTDASLNYLYIQIVQNKLIKAGITKYNSLVSFNKKIMVISITLDILNIALMSLPNSFVYALYQGLSYLAKLNIEMAMSDLMILVANANSRGTNTPLQSIQSGIRVDQHTSEVSELDPTGARYARQKRPKVARKSRNFQHSDEKHSSGGGEKFVGDVRGRGGNDAHSHDVVKFVLTGNKNNRSDNDVVEIEVEDLKTMAMVDVDPDAESDSNIGGGERRRKERKDGERDLEIGGDVGLRPTHPHIQRRSNDNSEEPFATLSS